jgi:hypothetical protein
MSSERSSDFIRGYIAGSAGLPPIDHKASQERGGSVNGMNQKSAAEEIKGRCFSEMEKDATLTYGDAFQRVTTADRNLAERYLFEARNPRGLQRAAHAAGESAAEEIKRCCFAEMARDSNLTYGDAFTKVTMADGELCERYLFEARNQILQGAEVKVVRDPKLSYTQAVKQSIFETCKNLDDSTKRAIDALLR